MDRRRWMIVGGGVLVVIVVGLVVLAPGLARRGHAWRQDQRLARYAPLIEKNARASGLSPDLIAAVVWAESGGDANAKSSANAKGLMQITPVTEKDVRQRHPNLADGKLTDPAYNLRLGSIYLAYLLERFDGNVKLALAAYHMGPTRVRRHQRANPGQTAEALLANHAGPKTRAYVARVMTRLNGS